MSTNLLAGYFWIYICVGCGILTPLVYNWAHAFKESGRSLRRWHIYALLFLWPLAVPFYDWLWHFQGFDGSYPLEPEKPDTQRLPDWKDPEIEKFEKAEKKLLEREYIDLSIEHVRNLASKNMKASVGTRRSLLSDLQDTNYGHLFDYSDNYCMYCGMGRADYLLNYHLDIYHSCDRLCRNHNG